MSNVKTNIIKSTGIYAFSTIVSQLINIFRGFFVPLILGPGKFGVLNTLKLILKYNVYSDLGICNSMGKKLPALYAKTDSGDVDKIVNTSLFVSLLSGFVVCISILIFAFIKRNSIEFELYVGLLVFSIIAIVQNFRKFFLLYIRSSHDFTLISKLRIFESSLATVLLLILVYFFGIYGAFASLFISEFLCSFYGIRMRRFLFDIKFDKKTFKSLIKVGLPLMTLGFSRNMVDTIDRVMILKFFDMKTLGYYSLGLNLSIFVFNIPSAFTFVMTPRIFELKEDDNTALKKYLYKPTYIVTIFIGTIVGIMYFLLPVIINNLMPDYLASVVPAQILMLSVLFPVLITTAWGTILCMNKMKHLTYIQIITILISGLLNYVFIKMGYGITGVAIATLSSYMINSFMILIYSSLRIFEKTNQALIFVSHLFLLSLYFVFMPKLIESFMGSKGVMTGYNIFFNLLFEIFIFLLFTTPFYFFLEKKTGILKDVTDLFKQKFFVNSSI